MIRCKNAASGAMVHHISLPNAAQSWDCGGESCGKNACSSSPSSTVTSDASNQSGNNADDAEEESMDTAWTDDRHSSYLSSMEETFVRNMFDKEYCAFDICGEAASSCEQDCAQSRPPSSFFKVMQGGGWQPWPCRRIHSWEIPSPTIFSSPWVRHFTSSKASLDEQSDPTAAASRPNERLICRTSTAYELEDDVPEVPDVENRAWVWLERIQGRSTVSSSANSIADTDKTSTKVDDASISLPPIMKSMFPMDSTIDQVVPLRSGVETDGDDQASCKHCSDKNEIVSSSSSSSDRNRRIHSSTGRRVVPRRF